MSIKHNTTISAADADRLLGHALDTASSALALAERYEAALREIADAPQAPGEGWYAEGYNAARGTLADIALTALEAGK